MLEMNLYVPNSFSTATKGLGAGNEFGTYIHVAAISSDGVLNTFWIYENCPIVRMKTS